MRDRKKKERKTWKIKVRERKAGKKGSREEGREVEREERNRTPKRRKRIYGN